MSVSRRLIIVDTDGGCDDALALVLALRAPNAEVLAITAVFGNVSVEQAAQNMSIVAQVFARDCPMVFLGADSSLLGVRAATWPGHGLNGLGDVCLDEFAPDEARIDTDEHAVTALLRLTSLYPGEIHMIALGPLTNLALAHKMCPQFLSRLKSLTIMGGSIFARGNVSFSAEFNFHCDPEAARIILAVANQFVPTLLVPWEPVCESAATWEQFDQLVALGTREATFIGRIMTAHERYKRSSNQSYQAKSKSLVVCDAWAVAAMLNPSVILELVTEVVHVELVGEHSRGMIAVDWAGTSGKTARASVMIAKRFDGDAVWDMLIKACSS